jgi:hypothetical protein
METPEIERGDSPVLGQPDLEAGETQGGGNRYALDIGNGRMESLQFRKWQGGHARPQRQSHITWMDHVAREDPVSEILLKCFNG